MSFISFEFCVFVIVLIILLAFIKNKHAQKLILLCASYLFYGLFDYRFLLILALFSVVVWLFAFYTHKFRERIRISKAIFVLSLIFSISVLCVFKYFNFFIESFERAFSISISVARIIVPTGISFYVFHAISYIVDCRRLDLEPAKYPLDVLLYIGFFSTIVCGPIQKSKDFIPKLRKGTSISKEGLSSGIFLFVLGLFKKVVIADRLSIFIDAIYENPSFYGSSTVLLCVLAYSIQIYCDFSGYSDMAIGVGKMIGIDLGVNFNLPYLAKNPSDFWKRWHISLSTWFRDYLYIPLGGNKKGSLRTCFNLFIVMILSGFWHGANWTFVIWGAIHGILSVSNKLICNAKKKSNVTGTNQESPIGSLISISLMYLFTCLAWVFFRANSLQNAFDVLRQLFSFRTGIEHIYIYVPIYLGLIFSFNILAHFKFKGGNPFLHADFSNIFNIIVFTAMVFAIIMFGYFGNSNFIYAQF